MGWTTQINRWTVLATRFSGALIATGSGALALRSTWREESPEEEDVDVAAAETAQVVALSLLTLSLGVLLVLGHWGRPKILIRQCLAARSWFGGAFLHLVLAGSVFVLAPGSLWSIVLAAASLLQCGWMCVLALPCFDTRSVGSGYTPVSDSDSDVEEAPPVRPEQPKAAHYQSFGARRQAPAEAAQQAVEAGSAYAESGKQSMEFPGADAAVASSPPRTHVSRELL